MIADYGNEVYYGETIVENVEYINDENVSINNNVALWVTIGVCAVIGIVLGIILGRKSAMK